MKRSHLPYYGFTVAIIISAVFTTFPGWTLLGLFGLLALSLVFVAYQRRTERKTLHITTIKAKLAEYGVKCGYVHGIKIVPTPKEKPLIRIYCEDWEVTNWSGERVGIEKFEAWTRELGFKGVLYASPLTSQANEKWPTSVQLP